MHARRCRAIDARTHPSIRACTRRWLQPNADGAAESRGRARIWASVHASMHERRCCTDGHNTHPRARARTRTRTRSRRHGFDICTHTYTYVLTHTHIYVSLVGRARPRRSRRALTRTYAHAHTRRQVLYICSLTYTYGLRHTHIYMYIVTHI